MAVAGLTILVLIVLVVVIYVFVEVKRFRHKLFAIFLIFLIIFTYFSFAMTFKGKDVDFKSVSGISHAFNIYFSWLGSVFKNIKTITVNAVHLDWKPNETMVEPADKIK